jgi:hypothetical protein
MSNHWHGVVTDPQARLPEFLERFHRLLARAQNAALGRWENLWSSDKPSVVALVSDEDVLEKMAYVVANPTAAGLVRAPHEWPGVITLGLSEHRVVNRPQTFFDAAGSMPPRVDLDIVRPPIYPDLDDASLARRLAAAVERRVRTARNALRETGRQFLGPNAVLRQSFRAVPHAKDLRRNPSPRIASKHTATRVRAIAHLLDFVRSYRAARSAWRSGARAILFPAGTYALRLHAGVSCALACPSGYA